MLPEIDQSPLYLYKAHVISVYDGDTITVNIDLGFNLEIKNQKIRLWGIDTPEIRGEERAEGLLVKQYVSDEILYKEIILQTIKDKTGKYGRWLGIIHYSTTSELLSENLDDLINLNEVLLLKNMAKPYY